MIAIMALGTVPVARETGQTQNMRKNSMDSLSITGGTRLDGTIRISGAKNAALPLQASCLMTDRPVQLDNMPALADTRLMADLLEHLGKQTSQNGDSWQMSGKVGEA